MKYITYIDNIRNIPFPKKDITKFIHKYKTNDLNHMNKNQSDLKYHN